MLQRKLATAWSVLSGRGFEEAARVSLEKAGMWWRHGAPFELGKLVGRPSSYARLDGCRFDLESNVITPSLEYLLLTGKHEAPERTLIRRHLDRSLPVVELGAALGVVSCVTNALLEQPANHVVVEANPDLLPVLDANRRRNRCGFAIVHGAIAYDSPVVSFAVASDILESSTRLNTASTVDVPSTSLTAILRTYPFQRFNLVCDIEGAEIDLVLQESDVLRDHVDVLIIEVHDRLVGEQACGEMMRLLERLGFELLERMWDTVAMRRVR
jgi:FkbM family methyltransferase